MAGTSSTLFFILHDSIHNSVFEGQIVQPLKKLLHNASYKKVILISFEPNRSLEVPPSLYDSSIELILFDRTAFFGKWSLKAMLFRLHSILKKEEGYFDIIARGPIAGYLMIQASKKTCFNQRIMQVRGLLAEEYKYTHAQQAGIKKILYYMRFKHYDLFEQYVYTLAHHNNVQLEAVSQSLKEYLIDHYHIPSSLISLAKHDIPAALSLEEKTTWSARIRQELNIEEEAYVYCYNGSAKSWQCPERIFNYFQECLKKKSVPVYLLILSQEPEAFKPFLAAIANSAQVIKIRSVSHAYIFQYLAACDEGIVFRNPHLINWVSRPTKVLEYQAAHLAITHNNTIGMLTITNQLSLQTKDLPMNHLIPHTIPAD